MKTRAPDGHVTADPPLVGSKPGPSATSLSVPLNPYMEERLFRVGREGPVLDLGCGRGWWLVRMRTAGLRPVGLEHETDRAQVAARHAPVVVGDATTLPFATATMGTVLCIHVLHHLRDPAAVLSEARRVLGPGGHLLLAETVEDNPAIRAIRRVRPEWDRVAVHSRFTADTLLALLDHAGLEVVDRRHHSLVSFLAWTLPFGQAGAWRNLNRLEDRLLPRSFSRWGAHLECLARVR